MKQETKDGIAWVALFVIVTLGTFGCRPEAPAPEAPRMVACDTDADCARKNGGEY